MIPFGFAFKGLGGEIMFIHRTKIKMRWALIFIVVFIVLQGCAATSKPTEHISFNIENYDQWKVLNEEDHDRVFILTFVPKEQTADNWKSMLESINVRRKDYPNTPREAQQKLENLRLQSCPETSIETIEEDQANVTFMMKSVNCPMHKNPYQLTKILYGEDNVFVLIYTHRGGEITQETKDQWLKSLKSAEIY
jgi:hypothetical protein